MPDRFPTAAENAARIKAAVVRGADDEALGRVSDAIVDDALACLRGLLAERRIDAASAAALLDHLSEPGRTRSLSDAQRIEAGRLGAVQRMRAATLGEVIALLSDLTPTTAAGAA